MLSGYREVRGGEVWGSRPGPGRAWCCLACWLGVGGVHCSLLGSLKLSRWQPRGQEEVGKLRHIERQLELPSIVGPWIPQQGRDPALSINWKPECSRVPVPSEVALDVSALAGSRFELLASLSVLGPEVSLCASSSRPALPVSFPAACPGASGPPGLPALLHLSVCLSVTEGRQAAALGRGDVSLRTGERDRKVTGASREGGCPELTLGVALEGQLGALSWGVGGLPRAPELSEVGARFLGPRRAGGLSR